MNEKSPVLTVLATKTDDKVAQHLAEKGITVLPTDEVQGNAEFFFISSRLVVERRTAAGFLNGIKDKSLFTNAIYLRENFEIPILILEGPINYERSAFNPEAVRGAQTALVLIYGVSLFASPDIDETTAVIALLTRQEQTGVPEISLVPKRKAFDLPDLQRRVVEMLPGCGMVTARQLLHHFGSIERITAAEPYELCQVPGIGPPKAAEMHQVLHADYEAIDTEKQIEDAVQAVPGILLDPPFELLERQLYIFTDQGERQIVDLVFYNPEANQLCLVELKRGAILPDHEAQLQGYLDRAYQSPVLRSRLEGGARLSGILATITEGSYKAQSSQISICILDRNRVIQVLKRLRQQHLQPASDSTQSK